VEKRDATEPVVSRKRRLSKALQEWGLLRAGLRVAAWIKAPAQPVGAVGAVFDDTGRVLLVEHVFRTDFPWGLPGGWIERGEDPRETVRREVEEELGLEIEVGALLASEQIGLTDRSTHPPHLGLAYCCRLIGGTCRLTREVVSIEWANPADIRAELAPFQLKAVKLGAALSLPAPRG
jgi:8-oxo-dGTP diphosphatase